MQKPTEFETKLENMLISLDANIQWIGSEKEKLIDSINLLNVIHQDRPFNDEEWQKYTESVVKYSNVVNMYSMAVDTFLVNFIDYNKLILYGDEKDDK